MLSRYSSAIFFSLMFFFLCYFFIKVHPLFVFDTDDWAYIQDTRAGRAWPLWGEWNPTKVFPEVFMPIISWLSVIVVYPFNNDYIEALSFGFGITLSCFVIILGIQFVKFCDVFFKFLRFESLLFCLFFLLFLFYPLYRHRNLYLLQSVDVTCIFNYTIPALLNFTVVLFLISINQSRENGEINYFSLSILIFAVYFSLNSNLFQSIILVSYVLSFIFFSVYDDIRKNKRFSLSLVYKEIRNCIHKSTLYFIIFVYFLIVLVYEANGGRASEYSTGLLELDVKSSIKSFLESIDKLQRPFHFLLSVNIFGVVLYFYKKRQHSLQPIDINYINLLLKLVASFIITISFLIMLCSKTGVYYLTRTDVVLSYVLYILFASLCSVSYIYKSIVVRYHVAFSLLPLFAILLLIRVVLCDTRYAETSMSNSPITVTKKISDDIVSQIISADKSSCSEIEILVPKFSSSDNMPLALYGSQRIPSALYNHRIISREVRVKFIPDESINSKYKID